MGNQSLGQMIKKKAIFGHSASNADPGPPMPQYYDATCIVHKEKIDPCLNLAAHMVSAVCCEGQYFLSELYMQARAFGSDQAHVLPLQRDLFQRHILWAHGYIVVRISLCICYADMGCAEVGPKPVWQCGQFILSVFLVFCLIFLQA